MLSGSYFSVLLTNQYESSRLGERDLEGACVLPNEHDSERKLLYLAMFLSSVRTIHIGQWELGFGMYLALSET